MADDLEKEYRELMERKGEDTPTPEEEAEPNGDQGQQASDDQGQGAGDQTQDQPAEAAQGAADPAKVVDPKSAPDIGEEAKKHIDNLKAMGKSEREKRRAETARAEAAEQRAANLEAQMRQFLAQAQAGQNKVPDPETDIVGTVKFMQQQSAAQQQAAQQQAAQQRQIAEQNRIADGIRTKVDDFEAEFKAEHPDYDEALEYVLDLKEAEFEAVGYQKPHAQAAAAQWAMNAAALMLRQGINPAESGYNQAMKLGFKPKGAAPAVDPNEAARKDAAAKIAQIKDGQAAGSRMSGGGGSTGYDGSLKSIGSLNGAAFDAAAEKFLRSTRG